MMSAWHACDTYRCHFLLPCDPEAFFVLWPVKFCNYCLGFFCSIYHLLIITCTKPTENYWMLEMYCRAPKPCSLTFCVGSPDFLFYFVRSWFFMWWSGHCLWADHSCTFLHIHVMLTNVTGIPLHCVGLLIWKFHAGFFFFFYFLVNQFFIHCLFLTTVCLLIVSHKGSEVIP